MEDPVCRPLSKAASVGERGVREDRDFHMSVALTWYTGLWRIPSFLHFNYFFGPFLLFLLFNYFFMQFLLFNYFFTEIHFFFIRGPKIGDFASKKFPLRGSFFSPILCENCPLHFNYFFKSFSDFTVHFCVSSGNNQFRWVFLLRRWVYLLLIWCPHSYIFLLFNYFFIMNIPSF